MIYDLLDSAIILSEAELLIKQNNIGNNTEGDIIFINKTIKIQLSNITLSNKVEPGDLSKEGLVTPEKLKVIKNSIDSITLLRIQEIVKKNKKNIDTLNDNNSIDYNNTDTFTIQIIDYSKASKRRNYKYSQEEKTKNMLICKLKSFPHQKKKNKYWEIYYNI